jgi:hypothetical protein
MAACANCLICLSSSCRETEGWFLVLGIVSPTMTTSRAYNLSRCQPVSPVRIAAQRSLDPARPAHRLCTDCRIYFSDRQRARFPVSASRAFVPFLFSQASYTCSSTRASVTSNMVKEWKLGTTPSAKSVADFVAIGYHRMEFQQQRLALRSSNVSPHAPKG